MSIVGIVFTAIELYQRFRQKDSSGSVQSPIYSITAEPRAGPRAEPKHSGAPSGAPTSGAMTERSAEKRSAVSSKIGMV